MYTKKLADGIHLIPFLKKIYKTCVKGKKIRQLISKAAAFWATRPLELVHSDLCGSLLVLSHVGSWYVITFTDDFSRYTWIYFLKFKNEALEKWQISLPAIQWILSKFWNHSTIDNCSKAFTTCFSATCLHCTSSWLCWWCSASYCSIKSPMDCRHAKWDECTFQKWYLEIGRTFPRRESIVSTLGFQGKDRPWKKH